MNVPPAAGGVAEVDGLQNERTSLAWVRASLSVVGAGALLARASGSSPPLAAAVLVVALVVGLALHVSADRTRRRRVSALARGDEIVSPTPLLATAVATIALAVVAVAVIAIR